MDSKPSDFGVGDMDHDPIFKQVDDSSIVPPDPQTTENQPNPAVEDAAPDKPEGAPSGVQKEHKGAYFICY